ncbi:class I SAM-dependent methyltransferase [Aureibacillus halotolerans]|uniref:Methyltransferase family protein n=1 Tax=Aureibacillus halotolerans TaxID=1508390 RepID=A0A4R6U5I5_9BACI|nr:class I SAM-dependent methyltransferase [Aureibacillus halotolerans]TDQ41481.1 methyltransferase family protein [Aureibacillus halotolerans]
MDYMTLLKKLHVRYAHPGGKELSEWIAVEAGATTETKLLDVGCGVGYSGALWKALGANVWGIDRDKDMVAMARQVHKGMDVQVAGEDVLPFETDFFSHVLAESVLAFVPQLDDLLQELHRVLKPGGALWCIELTLQDSLHTLSAEERSELLAWYRFRRIWTNDEWTSAFAKAGFSAELQVTGTILDSFQWVNTDEEAPDVTHLTTSERTLYEEHQRLTMQYCTKIGYSVFCCKSNA